MIRLQRVGKKHDPSFRIVLVDSRRAAKSGSFLKILGSYNAQKGEPQVKADEIKEWISKGAQVSDTVHNILVKTKVLTGKKIDVLSHTRIKAKLDKKKPAEEKAPAPSAEPVVEKGEAKEKPAPEPVAEEKVEEKKEETLAVEEKVEEKAEERKA